jgi:Spy/CpxP family protein refolding chaperone
MGGGHGGPPRPGEIMPGFIQDQLQLTDTQRQQLATLQSGVDAQLLQILTTQQIQQLAAGPQNFGNGNGAKGSGRKGRSSKNSQ